MNTQQSLGEMKVQPTRQPRSGGRARLETQLATAASLLTFLVVAALTFIYYNSVRQSLRQSFSERLRDLAGVIASQVDGDLHATLLDNDQKFLQDYNTIRDNFVKMTEAAPEIVFIYTLRIVGDDVNFVVDSDPDPTDINEVYDDVSDFARSQFNTITGPVADTEFYTDEWGTFLSGYAPVYTSAGNLDAVLAVDMNASTVIAREREVLRNMLLVVVPLMIILGSAGFVYGRIIARSFIRLTEAVQRYMSGDLNQRILPGRLWAREAFELSLIFNEMADRFVDILSNMEARVSARSQEAERRAAYVQAASEVSAATANIRESERLARQVVELIRDSFKLYYVGLFLVDESGEWAVLRSGTGDAGMRMISRGHRIQVGKGMIGWSIANAQARISLEAGEDAVRLATSELPLTRSEAAIPLRSRERVLGALSVQSTEPNAFDQSILLTFQTMADQIAVALDNARLLKESQAALDAIQRSYQQITQRGWLEFLQTARTTRGYKADALGVVPAAGGSIAQMEPLDDNPGTLAISVRVRGQELGRIVASKPANRGAWRTDEVELMQDIVEQISGALENARLYSETQRSAERERILSDITAVVRSSTSVDAILQSAVRQLASALNAPQAAIRLYSGETDQLSAPEPRIVDSPVHTGPAVSEPEPTDSTPAVNDTHGQVNEAIENDKPAD